MPMSYAGLRLNSDCSGKAQKQLHSKLQTRPLVREGTTKITKPTTAYYMEKEKLVTGPKWAPDTKTDWRTDCRSYINFTSVTEEVGELSVTSGASSRWS
jgi:hypothetical protein